MRALVQRVGNASVRIGDAVVGKIGTGMCVFLGVGERDGSAEVERLWRKISKLRIFPDETGKANVSAADAAAEVLIVSQFTLYADCRRGNRPSYGAAAGGEAAKRLYEEFIACARSGGIHVETGVFGAMMDVFIHNDGPFTIWLDTDEL